MLNQLGSADQIGHDLADLCLHHRSHGAACGSSRPGRCGPVDLPLPAVRAQERLLRSGSLRASLGRPLRRYWVAPAGCVWSCHAGLGQLGRSAARIARWAGLGGERILTQLPLLRLAEVAPR
jgi:hypothetical protein